jgi:hypothetical protein
MCNSWRSVHWHEFNGLRPIRTLQAAELTRPNSISRNRALELDDRTFSSRRNRIRIDSSRAVCYALLRNEIRSLAFKWRWICTPLSLLS